MDKKLSERILASAGAKKASLVLKHGTVVNVFTAGLEQADIAIEDGCIVGLGDYEGVTEIDLKGAVVCPSLIDGHIHLESSMVAPGEEPTIPTWFWPETRYERTAEAWR